MSLKNNTLVAEKLVDFSGKEADTDTNMDGEEVSLVQDLELEQQVQDDLQRNLDATQLYLSEIEIGRAHV